MLPRGGSRFQTAKEPLNKSHMSRVSGAMVSGARPRLPTEGAANRPRVIAKRGQQAIVVAAAVTDAMAGPVERHARHQHPIDGRGCDARTMRQRFGDAAITARDVTLEIDDRVELEHAARQVY